jgi:hypothetical protein
VAPDDAVQSIRLERDEIKRMRSLSHLEDSSFMSKMTRDSFRQQNRKRGRRRPSSTPETPDSSSNS